MLVIKLISYVKHASPAFENMSDEHIYDEDPLEWNMFIHNNISFKHNNTTTHTHKLHKVHPER